MDLGGGGVQRGAGGERRGEGSSTTNIVQKWTRQIRNIGRKRRGLASVSRRSRVGIASHLMKNKGGVTTGSRRSRVGLATVSRRSRVPGAPPKCKDVCNCSRRVSCYLALSREICSRTSRSPITQPHLVRVSGGNAMFVKVDWLVHGSLPHRYIVVRCVVWCVVGFPIRSGMVAVHPVNGNEFVWTMPMTNPTLERVHELWAAGTALINRSTLRPPPRTCTMCAPCWEKRLGTRPFLQTLSRGHGV
eukprot:gene13201-biopygen8000